MSRMSGGNVIHGPAAVPSPMDETAKSANARQVGGDHYKTGGVEHWDLFGPEYLMGCLTKYVSRWRKKNGVQDLEKALHYAQKLMESHPGFYSKNVPLGKLEAWARSAELDWPEFSIIQSAMNGGVQDAIRGIEWLMGSVGKIPSVREQLQRVERREAYDPDLADGYAQRDGKTVLVRERREDEAEAKSPARERAREDADESRHASLFPWRISDAHFMDLPSDRIPHLRTFYTKRGDYWHLDEFVESAKIPAEIQHCYAMQVGALAGSWLIRLQDVPEDLRDMYSYLPREKNAKEHEALPPWQQARYVWHDDKYRLTDAALAAGWGRAI